MDYQFRLENNSNIADERSSNYKKIELQQRYLYYTQLANRLNRLRFGGVRLDPMNIIQIKHIFEVEKENVEINFSEAELEKTIFTSIRINNL